MEWPLSKSLKDINKKKNFDLKNINHWLRANKISLNNDSLQINKKIQIKKHMNFRISGQKKNIIK